MWKIIHVVCEVFILLGCMCMVTTYNELKQENEMLRREITKIIRRMNHDGFNSVKNKETR